MTTTYDNISITYTTMQALLPVLSILDGDAMQNERVISVTWSDTHDEHTGLHTGQEITCVTFPYGELRKVKGGWVLSINGEPSAIFAV